MSDKTERGENINPKYESLTEYIQSEELEYLVGHNRSGMSKIEILQTMFKLYEAAVAIGEITWESMMYCYADFTAKLLNVR